MVKITWKNMRLGISVAILGAIVGWLIATLYGAALDRKAEVERSRREVERAIKEIRVRMP